MFEYTLAWIHPIMEAIATLLGIWAMWQGWQRVRMNRGIKVLFPWAQHVRIGIWAHILWICGGLGFYVTHSMFGMTHMTGTHAEVAWPVMGLSAFALVTGIIMNKYKKRRKVLPIIHGVANAILLALVFVECWTGIQLLPDFL